MKVHVYTPNVEEHGWESRHTVVETVVDDMPFLVDSVSMALTRSGAAIHLVIRQIMRVRRDDEGRLLEVGGEEGLPESLIHVEIDRQTSPEALERMRAGLCSALEDVRAAVDDWPTMRERVRGLLGALDESVPPVAPDELAEARGLLEWIHDDHFTFLGYREYDILTEDGEDVLRAVSGSGLGILRAGERAAGLASASRELSPEVRRLAREKSLLTLTKANSRATVHRPAYLDYIGVKRFDASGEVAGERRFLGLYTHTAYSESPWAIPVLRRKAQRVVERSGLSKGSHDYKALVEILGTYPRDELFQISGTSSSRPRSASSTSTSAGACGSSSAETHSAASSRASSTCRASASTRGSPANRRDPQAAFGGVERRLHAQLSESVLARAPLRRPHRARRGAGVRRRRDRDPPGRGDASLGDDSGTRSRSNSARSAAGRSSSATARRSPAAYREDFTPRQAVADIERIERLDPDGDLGMSLYVPLESRSATSRSSCFARAQPLLLSDVLPLLENMGVGSATSGRTRSSPRRAASGSTTSGSATTKEPSSRRTSPGEVPGRVRSAPGAARRRTTASTVSSCGAG